MKFKRSISIILSAAMIANFTCAQLVSAQSNSVNTVIADKNKSDAVEVQTPSDKKETKKYSQENNENEADIEDNKTDNKGHLKVSNSQSKQDLINRFLSQNSGYFPSSKVTSIKSKLQKLSYEDIRSLSGLSLKDPTVMTLVSAFFGGLGVDRMIIGKVGTGVLKFLLNGTIVGGVIWWIVDIFRMSKMTKKHNYKLLVESIEQI